MNDGRWADAVREFDRTIAAKGGHTDAALYWKAYSLRKMSRSTDAATACDMLRAQYPASTWNKDCATLSLDVHVDVNAGELNMPMFTWMPADASAARGSDADLKLLALNSLMNHDPSRAIPIARGLLAGNQSMSVKKHVIFVLAQSRSPEAASILHDAVTGKMDPELQGQAIQMMGIFQGKRANDTLAEVYRTTSDVRVKKAVISAFFVSQDAPRLVDLARGEKDMELKRSIVSQLALMNDKAANDYMLELLK